MSIFAFGKFEHDEFIVDVVEVRKIFKAKRTNFLLKSLCHYGFVFEGIKRIADIFRHTDKGCQNRLKGTCKCGVRYVFENEETWHCGCCGAPFKIYPVIEDIPHYGVIVFNKMRRR